MKTINETFDDEEYTALKAKKGKNSWHDFIMQLLDKDEIQRLASRLPAQSTPLEPSTPPGPDYAKWNKILSEKFPKI
ncbi:MAG: hypothetical protein ABSA79_10525 [Candidatus Bathyarchaeia archaeon]|jgi:hypothetical protein